VHPKDIPDVGHWGKHRISPKEVIRALIRSPLGNLPDQGDQLHVYLMYLRHPLETIYIFDLHVLPPLHHDIFQENFENPPVAFQQTSFGWQQNQAGQMLQQLPICPNNGDFQWWI
jgi:hypothetical protein